MAAGGEIIVDYESGPNKPIGLPATSHATMPATVQGSTYLEDEKASYPDEKGDVAGVAAIEVYRPNELEGEEPTEEELRTLRKVPAPMPWAALGMCVVELAERASYYGVKDIFSNYIRGPLPKGGNGAGAVAPGAAGANQSSGALGMGSKSATALVQMFNFLTYTIPIFGAYIADTKWGRFKTIMVGILIGAVAHVLLIIPALPSVIAAGTHKALGAFIVSILILAFAAGFIKPSLAPLLCDQSPVTRPIVQVRKNGERVIVDPETTVQRWLTIFYTAINVGAFYAIASVYAERKVGFWLAWLCPGIFYMLCPIVLIFIYKKLYKAPPQGSVMTEAVQVFKALLRNGGWRRMFRGGDSFWETAKPSYMLARDPSLDKSKIIWDDRFVDELRQSIAACAIFFIIPVFTLGDGGLGNSENAMSAAMTVNGVPNDLISNFNALTIVFVAPLLNYGLYPLCERLRIPLKPMTRLSIGFFLCSINMIYGAVLQWRVYVTSPCGYSASTCDDVSPVSLWLQLPLYVLPAIGELFVNVTAYQIAYTRAPARMKGLVYAINLFTQAIAAAITLACAAVVTDPYLIWPYVALAVANFALVFVFPTYFRHLNDPVQFNDRDRMEGKQDDLITGAAEAH